MGDQATVLRRGRTRHDRAATLEERIIDATLRCLARWGTVKTTLDDIAREAGCSRATVYRTFPGGRDALFAATGEREIRVALSLIAVRADAARNLEEMIGNVLAAGVSAVRHHKVLRYLIEHEPGVVLPYVSFDGMDPLLSLVRTAVAPHLLRFLDPGDAADVAEWIARAGMSYGFEPLDAPDMSDPDVARAFVSTYLMPGLTGREHVPEADRHDQIDLREHTKE